MSWDQRTKRNAVLLLLGALVTAVVLASSLGSVELPPGSPFPGAGNQAAVTPAAAAPRALAADESLLLFQGLLAAILVALFLYLLVRFITFSNIKRLIGAVLALTAILVLLLSLPRVPAGQPINLPPESAGPAPASTQYPTSPLGSPPPAFLWIAAIGGLAGVVLVAVVALRQRTGAATISHKLKKEAEQAIESIEAGADARNVIVRCYLQMIELIQRERGMKRERNLTVREFEEALEELGLPKRALSRLSSLFEAVRYGNRPLSPKEEQSGLSSLNEMVAFFRGNS